MGGKMGKGTTSSTRKTQRMKTEFISKFGSLIAKVGLENFVWVLVGVAGLFVLLFILKPRG